MLMKKRLTWLLGCLLASLPSMAQVLFSTSFDTIDDFTSWKVYDVNGDEKTWQFNIEADPHVFCPYNSSEASNDWLISPAITAAEDVTLMVSYTIKGSYYGENLGVYYGAGDAVDDMTSEGAVYEALNGDVRGGYFLMEAKAGKAFHVGFKCFSNPDKWRLSLASVEVKVAKNPLDLKVDEITSPVTGPGLAQEKVKIKVSNIGFAAASDYTVGYRIDNGEPVVEKINKELAPGESIEYEFATPADLSIPRHLYSVKAFAINADDIDNTNDTLEVNVRHKAPASVPYSTGFEPTEDLSDLKFFNLNEDGGEWQAYMSSGWFSMARNGYGCLAYNYSKENNGNDWAILEPIQVEAGYHALKFWYSATSDHPEKFSVYWGTEPTVEAMTNKIVDYNPALNDAYQESINLINFPENQTVYIGFYCYSDKDENWLTIDDLTLDKVSSTSVDLAIRKISNPTNYIRTESDRTVKLEVRNIGIISTEVTVNISVDDKLAATSDYTVKAQEFKTIEFKDVLADLAEGTHSIKVELVCDKDENAENNVLVQEVKVLGTPVIYYDFEDGELPAALTYETKDEGTQNPNAGPEFNEYGWGIFPLVTHPVLGNYVMAGNSWVDGVNEVDRWVYFPRVKVTGENADFVWNANSFSTIFLEDYNVKVCDDPYNSWGAWYSTVMSVKQESIYTKCRGISLGKYVGKEIDIAINLVSKNCEALILDNIGFYGDISTDITTGVKNVNATDGAIIVDDQMITAGNGNAAITIFDASGRIVSAAQGNAAVSQLQPGVYMATVKTAAGKRTVKFIKK